MSEVKLEAFSVELTVDTVAAMRNIAASQGRSLDAVLEDAMRAYIGSQAKTHGRSRIMGSLEAFLEEFEGLYRRLED